MRLRSCACSSFPPWTPRSSGPSPFPAGAAQGSCVLYGEHALLVDETAGVLPLTHRYGRTGRLHSHGIPRGGGATALAPRQLLAHALLLPRRSCRHGTPHPLPRHDARRHRRALPYPSRRVWTCQTSQIWYAPMSPKQSDFDSETAFIPHLSITQPDWNMNSTMSAYDIRLKPVRRGRRIRMSAHTSTWARCRCRRIRIQVNSSLPRLLTRNPEGPFYWRTRPVWSIATVVR